MNNPPFGLRPRALKALLRANLEQGAKHRVETCKKAFVFLAGAYSPIYRIRE